MHTEVHIKPVYSIPEFCAEFRIGRTNAYAEIKAGRLRSFKVGDLTRIAGEDALAWRERYRGGNGPVGADVGRAECVAA